MDMTIAETIRAQIGNRALAMLGAHSFVGGHNWLQFRVKGSRRCNCIVVTLDEGTDTYEMKFLRIGRAPAHRITEVAQHSDVYVDSLHDLIEQETCLYTRL